MRSVLLCKDGNRQNDCSQTSAAKWFRQHATRKMESDAFRDLVVRGIGWTETRLDYEDNPQGDPKVDRTDPLEMVWDGGAKKRKPGRRAAHSPTEIVQHASIPLEQKTESC